MRKLTAKQKKIIAIAYKNGVRAWTDESIELEKKLNPINCYENMLDDMNRVLSDMYFEELNRKAW